MKSKFVRWYYGETQEDRNRAELATPFIIGSLIIIIMLIIATYNAINNPQF